LQNTSWTASDYLKIAAGANETASLTVVNQATNAAMATLTSSNVKVGTGANATGNLTVTGAKVTLSVTNFLDGGLTLNDGTGNVTFASGAQAKVGLDQLLNGGTQISQGSL